MSNETLNETVIKANETLQLFLFYYTPCLVSLGIIGNCLSVFIFFKTKLRKHSSSYYLAALALSDTFNLLLYFLTWLTFLNIDLFNKPVFCEASVYLSSVGSFLSVWLVVAFTAERFFAVGYPFRRQGFDKMSHTTRAEIVILILLLVALLIYSPCLFFAVVRDIPPRGMTCTSDLKLQQQLNVFNTFDALITYAIPVIGIIILNVFIGFNMWKMAKVRKGMTYHQSSCRRKDDSAHKCKRKPTAMSQYKITKMLLIVSTTCLCLNMPSYIMRILAGLYDVSITCARVLTRVDQA